MQENIKKELAFPHIQMVTINEIMTMKVIPNSDDCNECEDWNEIKGCASGWDNVMECK